MTTRNPVKPQFDPSDTLTQFVSLADIKEFARNAKSRFQRTKKVYKICRAHCRMFGGVWPQLTRRAKIRYFEAAINCRQWQHIAAHMEANRSNVKLG